MMPTPSLPVDSAMSCSAQVPKVSMPGEAMIVILSRPNSLAATPMAAPRRTPGLAAGGTAGPQERTIMRALSRNSRISTPAAAAGTRPKAESTE